MATTVITKGSMAAGTGGSGALVFGTTTVVSPPSGSYAYATIFIGGAPTWGIYVNGNQIAGGSSASNLTFYNIIVPEGQTLQTVFSGGASSGGYSYQIISNT